MTVFLVGAGPGDPGLVTLRAAELLGAADVVVHDRLVGSEVLAMARASARLVDVGKGSGAAPGGPAQEEINALLVDLAATSGVVVRLKGGDPYVLGRGGEEALALARAGVAYEVVPGLSAATAAPAAAGVPVTLRGVASGFVVVTGHDVVAEDSPLDWSLLARSGCTLVVLMGVAARGRIARRLLDAGSDPSTPVVVVEQATTPRQRSSRTTLAGLGDLPVTSPATIVVGAAAGQALASLEQRPLHGWRVVVTRPRAQAGGLSRLLAAAGAEPVALPVVQIGDPGDGGRALRAEAARLATYDWVVLSSANGVERLLAEVRDARAFGTAQVAAVGRATADALARHGVVADLVPDRYVGECLAAAFPPAPPGGPPSGPSGRGGVLVVRAAVARDVVPDALASLGWRVVLVDAYATSRATPSEAEREAVAGARAVTFTSPSTVEGFLDAVGSAAVPPVVVSIGPVTTAAARAAGLDVDVEACEQSSAGIVAALSDHARGAGSPQPAGSESATGLDR